VTNVGWRRQRQRSLVSRGTSSTIDRDGRHGRGGQRSRDRHGGIGRGVSDLHYGNNVPLEAGHTYEMVVTVNKEPATFTIRV
jgi:hypothetical protein